jgi:hypothetical protein
MGWLQMASPASLWGITEQGKYNFLHFSLQSEAGLTIMWREIDLLFVAR